MDKRRQLVVGLACLGFVVAGIFWAYSAFGYSEQMNLKKATLTIALVILCPPSLLSVPFWETEPDTVPGIVIWSVIGLINSALYAYIGTYLSKRIWKPDKPE